MLRTVRQGEFPGENKTTQPYLLLHPLEMYVLLCPFAFRCNLTLDAHSVICSVITVFPLEHKII